jgi:uncharacterized integral membrane protein
METKKESSNLSTQIKSGIVLLLLCLVIIFALQNSETVTVVFLWWEQSLPRVLIFFVFFLVGFLCGIAISNWRRLTHKKTPIN